MKLHDTLTVDSPQSGQSSTEASTRQTRRNLFATSAAVLLAAFTSSISNVAAQELAKQGTVDHKGEGRTRGLTNEEIASLSAPAKAWLKSGSHKMIRGHSIFVTDRGQGTPILLLHGHPSSCHDWKAVCDRLESKARPIAFDMVGYGLSDKPEAFSYSVFQQTDIAQGLIEQLGLPEVHVVSHDISTSVHDELLARELEGKLPFKILSSMFLNGSILQWVSSEPESQNKFQRNETIFEGMKGLPEVQENLPEILKRITFKHIPDADYSLKQELMGFRDGHLRLASQSVYMRERYIHADRWIGAMEKASRLRICWAKDDPIANVQIGRELEQRCKQADYIEWAGVGHFPNFEDPDFVAKQIEISTGIVAKPEE